MAQMRLCLKGIDALVLVVLLFTFLILLGCGFEKKKVSGDLSSENKVESCEQRSTSLEFSSPISDYYIFRRWLSANSGFSSDDLAVLEKSFKEVLLGRKMYKDWKREYLWLVKQNENVFMESVLKSEWLREKLKEWVKIKSKGSILRLNHATYEGDIE